MPPSRTAAGVARSRVRLTRPATTDGDPDADQRLSADLAGEFPDAPVSPMFHHIAARTQFFDRVTLDAVEGGTTQVVIVGAGYDGRALRFRRNGVRYFELDLPATQTDKRARLARLGIAADDIAFVPIDLNDGHVDGALAASGHDAAQTSLFICEGLLVYLDTAVVERLFVGLRDRVGGDATLALSASRRDRPAVDEASAARRSEFRQRMAQIGEPWLTSLDASGWSDLLEATGWRYVSSTDPHDLDPEAPAGGAMLITAEPRPRT